MIRFDLSILDQKSLILQEESNFHENMHFLEQSNLNL